MDKDEIEDSVRKAADKALIEIISAEMERLKLHIQPIIETISKKLEERIDQQLESEVIRRVDWFMDQEVERRVRDRIYYIIE